MEYILELAEKADAAAIFPLYVARVRWMDEIGLKQWNVTEYLRRYPVSYYEAQCEQHTLYALREREGCVLHGAVVLLPKDVRWADAPEKNAWYVHNLVTGFGRPGAGAALLHLAEKLALENGMQYLRLDCAEDNVKLNAWYEAQGYLQTGTCTDGPYHGIRREKRI